jgi:hypothetical protein
MPGQRPSAAYASAALAAAGDILTERAGLGA